MAQKFFHEYRFISNPQDFSRLPLCEHGQDFLLWVSEWFPDLFESPNLHILDQATLTMTIEYGYRNQTVVRHGFNACLREVFEELLGMVTDIREELLRHQAGYTGTIYIGADGEEQEE